MKSYALFSLIAALLLTGNISFAQNSILAGKIVDENNKPIAGAMIRLSKQGETQQDIKADGDGLFSGKLMAAGHYSLSVSAKGHNLKMNDFILDPKAGSEKYYIIKVAKDKLVVDRVNEDPAIKVKLASIEKSKHNDVDGIYFTRTKTDSATGKTQTTTQGPDGGVPSVK